MLAALVALALAFGDGGVAGRVLAQALARFAALDVLAGVAAIEVDEGGLAHFGFGLACSGFGFPRRVKRGEGTVFRSWERPDLQVLASSCFVLGPE